MLMVVRQLACHEAVGALKSIVSGEGEAELHRRHRGERQESLVLWSKGIVKRQRKAFIGKEGWRGGSRGEAVERSRRYEVLLVLDFPLQFHPPVLKPRLDLRNRRDGRRGSNSSVLCLQVQTTAVHRTFPCSLCFNCLCWTDARANQARRIRVRKGYG